MKRLLLVFITALLFGTPTFASHLLGGEVYWESVGSNQIILKLRLYAECGAGAVSFPGSVNLSSNLASASTIPMTQVSATDISPSCQGGGGLACGTSPAGVGAIKLHEYESSPITINSIPATGYYFEYRLCCRPSSVVNLGTAGTVEIRSTLYPGALGNLSSPHFQDTDLYLNTKEALNLSASTPKEGDSLYYDFYSMPGANFTAGASLSNPLISPSTSHLDHETGIMHYDVQASVTGHYAMGVEVQCWRNGHLASVVRRDANYLYRSGLPSNNPPLAIIDTSMYQNIVRDSLGYELTVQVGDTVQFDMAANDYDFLPSAVPQSMTFSATGSALSNLWNGNLSFQSHPVLAPVAPQTSYVSPLNNNVSFSWVTAPEHISGTKSSYYFVFQFKDNACPIIGRTMLPVKITLTYASYISDDTLRICQGDTAQLSGTTLSGNYSWSPSTDISSTTVAAPKVSPATSQYYYLEDPQHPGHRDSVYIEVEQRAGFNLTYANSLLELDDSVNAGSRLWYYNGIPFNYPYDTLSPFAPGYYFVKLATDLCEYQTDTVLVQPGSFSVVQPGNGGYNGHQASAPGSIGVTFSLDGSGTLSSINIPGVTDLETDAAGYDLTVKIYDDMQLEQLKKSIQLQPPFSEIIRLPVNFAVAAGKDYTIAITGDTSYAFSFYENVNVPSTPWNNGLNLKSYTEGMAGMYPQSATDYLIPLGIEVSNFVGVAELTSDAVAVYPNPAADELHIKLAAGGGDISLLSLDGKVLRHLHTEHSEHTLQRGDLASGVYLLKISADTGVVNQRVIFK